MHLLSLVISVDASDFDVFLLAAVLDKDSVTLDDKSTFLKLELQAMPQATRFHAAASIGRLSESPLF
jgi:hypothetical protein